VDDVDARWDRARGLAETVNGHPEQVPVVLPTLLEMLDEEADPTVLVELIAALGFTDDSGASFAMVPFSEHPDEDVRLAVARNALPINDEQTETVDSRVEALIKLTEDPVDDVRDWACFTLRLRLNADLPPVREALAARLNDPHDDTRCEALVGLAYRKDPRALEAVTAALQDDEIYLLELEAAAVLGDPSLHPLLAGHIDGWDSPDAARTAQAAWRLTDPAGLGQDLTTGLADAVRAIAAGERENLGDDPWWDLYVVIDDIAPERLNTVAADVDAALAGNRAARQALRKLSLGEQLPPAP
jgi:HEAT repeat protein